MEYFLPDINATKELAKKIALISRKHDIVCLKGDLGVGKTTFARFFINNFYDEEVEVVSPTFTIIQNYDTKTLQIYHFDLYRLKNKNDVYEVGIEDAFDNGLSLIEWPEIIEDILPANRLEIAILNYGDKGRKAVVSGWEDRLR